jgi:hypothetical protein
VKKIKCKLEEGHIFVDLLQEKQVIFQNFQSVLKKEEEMWHIKSHNLWLQAEDKNTSFFHCQSKARLWKNKVEEIKSTEGGAHLLI